MCFWNSELHAAISVRANLSLSLGNNVSFTVIDAHGDDWPFTSKTAIELCVNGNKRCVVLNTESANKCAPCIECHSATCYKFYRTVESSTGIPSATFLHILEMNLKSGVRAYIVKYRCDVNAEGIISVGPATHFLTIDIYFGLTHGSIKQKFGTLGACGQFKLCPVVTFTNPWQCS